MTMTPPRPISDAVPGSAPTVPSVSSVSTVPEVPEVSEVVEVSTWHPIDVAAILAGDVEQVAPTQLPRSDGAPMFYDGLVHAIIGESESGKSLIVQELCRRVLMGGGQVLYLDHESSAFAVIARLRQLGVPDEVIAARLTYIRPHEALNTANRYTFAKVLNGTVDLVVVDGITEALSVVKPGTSSNDNDGVAAFMNDYPRWIANATGATVIVIDHPAKNTETRGRFAHGAQSKMSALDGAAYIVEPVHGKPLGRGKVGVVHLRVGKDREGGIRPISGEMRSDRTQLTAVATIDDTGHHTVVTFDPPGPDDTTWKPTHLMERVSKLLEVSPEPLSRKVIAESVGGRKSYVLAAITALADDQHITTESGPRGAILHGSATPYREPASNGNTSADFDPFLPGGD